MFLFQFAQREEKQNKQTQFLLQVWSFSTVAVTVLKQLEYSQQGPRWSNNASWVFVSIYLFPLVPCTVRHYNNRIEMATANSSSDNLLDKLQFNDGGGDSFTLLFFTIRVSSLYSTHTNKCLWKSLPPPPISKHPECSYSRTEKSRHVWFQNFNKKAKYVMQQLFNFQL